MDLEPFRSLETIFLKEMRGRARPALPLHRKIAVACSKSVCKTPFPARQSVGCSHEESRERHRCYKADGASFREEEIDVYLLR